MDVIVEIVNYKGRIELEEKLGSYGFAPDVESGIICRYKVDGIIVDIMPTDDASIGFKNRWYPEGFREAVDCNIDPGHTVKILSAPYFIATKLEAFKGRGGRDGRTSQDFEDIVFVLENKSNIWEEMTRLHGEIRDYLLTEFSLLLTNPHIFEWLDAHVERGSPPVSYSMLQAIKTFTNTIEP